MMEAPDDKPPFAWQPLTPQGVAAFAAAPLGRLLVVQFIFALLAAAAVVWFLHKDWFPTITEAIRQLPVEGEIRSGSLDWHGEPSARLAEGRFLAVTVDLEHSGATRSPAHVQVEFGRADVQVFSLLGFVQLSYPRAWWVAFNQGELEPWWGAWSPWILAIVAGLVIGGLMLVWIVLATVYCVPVWLVGLYANRDVSLCGSWRLAGAALMPGALVLIAAILAYGLGAWDLVRLAAAGGAHLVIGWVYLVASPLGLARHPEARTPAGNPFKVGQAKSGGTGTNARD